MIFFALLAACLRCSDCNDRKERPVSVDALVTAYSSLFVSLTDEWFELCSFSVPGFVYFCIPCQVNHSKCNYQIMSCGFVTFQVCYLHIVKVYSLLFVSPGSTACESFSYSRLISVQFIYLFNCPQICFSKRLNIHAQPNMLWSRPTQACEKSDVQ